MFDPVKLRALADRTVALQIEAKAVREDIGAMLPKGVSEDEIAAWPEADQECRRLMLNAIVKLGAAGAGMGVAIDELGNATIGVQI